MLGAADQIVPYDRRRMVELEPPVRPPPLRLEPGAVLVGQGERGAVVDRRLAPAEQHLALELELLRGLVGGIGAPGRREPRQRRLVAAEPRRLAMLLVGGEAEPGEIVADRLGDRLARCARGRCRRAAG